MAENQNQGVHRRRKAAIGDWPVVLSLLVLSISCSSDSSPTAPSGSGAAVLDQRLVSEHFDLRYSIGDISEIAKYSAALEGSFSRITEQLGVPAPGRVTGLLYPDAESYTLATGLPCCGSVRGSNQFRVSLEPLLPSVAVHEFAHNVTLHLNPRAPEQVWLWESVAVYEAHQAIHPATVPCLARREFPSIITLGRSDTCSVYEVGASVVELILEDWGEDTLQRLIRIDGDIEATLGVTVAEFQRRWEGFLIERYLAD